MYYSTRDRCTSESRITVRFRRGWKSIGPTCCVIESEMQSSRMQHHSRFHSHSSVARDIIISSVPAPALSNTRRDLWIEARAHRSSLPPNERLAPRGRLLEMQRGCLSPLSDCDPFFTTRTWRKLKLAWLLHVVLAPAPCRTCASVAHPKTQRTGGFAVTS